MSDLKPCPCCGSEEVFFESIPDSRNWVICGNCGLTANSMDTEPEADSLAVWNRRTQPEATAPAQDLSAAILALPLPDAFGVLHYNRAIGFAGRLQGYTADQMRGLLKDAAALASSANSRFDGSISKLGAPEAFVPSSPANALRATDKDAKIAAQRARILALEEQLARALGTPVNDWCPECHARESSGDALGAGG